MMRDLISVWLSVVVVAAILFLVVVLLSGCATTEPIPQAPKEAKTIVRVPCVTPSDLPAPIKFITDKELAAMPDDLFVYAYAKDRLDRATRMERMEALLQGCLTLTKEAKP